MSRSEKIEAAQAVVSQASTALTLALVEEIAEPLAEFMVGGYEAEDWQESPLVEALAPALLEVDGREVPDAILEALKIASEAGRPVGVA